jgi:ketosteroid isomerase-like protein
MRMDPIEELRAREAIKAVKARYCRFIDTKDWPGYASLFTADAMLDVSADTGQPPFHGKDLILQIVAASVDGAVTTHHVHSPEINFTGADAAHVIWAMQDRLVWRPDKAPPPGQALTGYGHYHEQYVRQDGDWKIAALKLTRLNLEWQAIAPGATA